MVIEEYPKRGPRVHVGQSGFGHTLMDPTPKHFHTMIVCVYNMFPEEGSTGQNGLA